MCTREVVLWVHVWSARMSVRLQSGHFSAEKVVTCSATKPYLKGCFVRTGHFAPAAAPVQAPRWNLESLLPRGLYCTRRASRAATCACTCGLPVAG